MTVHVSSRLVKRQARHQNEMQKLFLRRFPQFPDQNPIDNFCSQKFKRMEGYPSRQARHQNEMQKVFLRRFPPSPDHNPIDNFCSQKFKRMEGKNPKNSDELWQNIEICWKAIPKSFCRNLAESLPNR